MTGQTAQTVYLDEAGYTGDNLLEASQPWFVYSSVAIDKETAEDLHREVRSLFRIGTNELKGRLLARSKRGRKAISWLLRACDSRSRFIIANKEYALAGEFFEYVFEPVVSEGSSLFYGIDFHKFIATLLHVSYRAEDPYALAILRDFEDVIRNSDTERIETMLSHIKDVDISSALGSVLVFALCHKENFEREISMSKDISGKTHWGLELSGTSVHWLLEHWGEKFNALDAYCDQSKPVRSILPMFDVFIGRKDKAYMPFFEHPGPSYVYNLSDSLKLVDSKEYPGIQIADVLASSMAYALRKPDEDHSKEWLDITREAIGYTISPSTGLLDLSTRDAYVNALVLTELVERSVRGQDLFEGMQNFIMSAKETFQHSHSTSSDVEKGMLTTYLSNLSWN